MSRYHITPHTDNSLEVVVGWDAPLSTYFANVIKPVPPNTPLDSELDDTIVLVLGTRPDQYLMIEDLQKDLKGYAKIPPDIADAMRRDSAEPYELSPIQEWVRNVLQKIERV
jgi:hypothetical protein